LEQFNRGSRFDISFLRDTQVPAGQSGLFDLFGKIGDLPAPRHLPALRSGLLDLAERISDLEQVSDTGIALQRSYCCKLFAEQCPHRYGASQPARPKPIVL